MFSEKKKTECSWPAMDVQDCAVKKSTKYFKTSEKMMREEDSSHCPVADEMARDGRLVPGLAVTLVASYIWNWDAFPQFGGGAGAD